MTSINDLWMQVRESEAAEHRRRRNIRENKERIEDAYAEGKISKVAYDAAMLGDITLERALEFGVEPPSDDTERYLQVRFSNAGHQIRPGSCLCGCGELPSTKKGRFMPGHDARMQRLYGQWLDNKIEISDAQLNYCVERFEI